MSHSTEQSIIGWSTQCVSTAVINGTASAIAGDYHHAIQLAEQNPHTWQVVAGLCIAAGLLLNLAGYSCFYFTLALAGFLTGLALLFGVTCGLSHSLLGALIAGFIGACLVAFLTVKAEKLGVLLMGAAGGFASYMFLNALVLNKIYEQFPATHQTYTPFLVAAVLAAIGAALAMCMERYIIIGATALAGAYMVGFGVDRLAFHTAHHVLNPLVLMSGGGCKDAQCYGVLAGMVVLAIVGWFVQLHHTAEKESPFSKRHDGEYTEVYYSHDLEAPLRSGDVRRVSRERIV